jgi:hypothetical protein
MDRNQACIIMPHKRVSRSDSVLTRDLLMIHNKDPTEM